MKKMHLLAAVAAGMLLQACQKEPETPVPAPEESLDILELKGYVQKGPFVSGTGVVLTELNKDLRQTGKTFNATIKNDQGAFSLQNVKLASKFVELRANGFYFNEVSGRLSTAQLTLSALADASDAGSVNVNLLTHLEKSRVEYLIGTEKKSFVQAKTQAQREILAVFNVSKPDIAHSEHLNIAEAGEDNAILLAVSAVLQAKRTESELTELLAKMSLDLETDGALNTTALQSTLLNEAVLLDQKIVRTHVANRYSELGMNIVVGDFEKHINHFIATSAFAFTKKIEYPVAGPTGINLLADTTTRIVVPKAAGYHWYNNPQYVTSFSVSAVAPVGTAVRVRITTLAVPDSPYGYISYGDTGGWQLNYQYDRPVELTLTGTGAKSETFFNVRLGNQPLRRRIEIFENNATVPSRIREVTFVGDNTPLGTEVIEYPPDMATSNGLNILGPGDWTGFSGQVSMVTLVPAGQKVKVRYTLNSTLQMVYTDGNWGLLTHQVVNGLDVYEYETLKSSVRAHNNLKCVRDARAAYMTPVKMKVEVFENGSSQAVRVDEFNWYQ
jgi:hypothetical protein